MVQAFLTYLRESVEELHLVRWPTRRQAIRLSAIVLLFSVICAAVFGLIDTLLGQLVRLYLSLFI